MKEIKNYEKACQSISKKINNIYFDDCASTDWVADEIGGIAIISDFFFDMDFMLTALRYNASEKQFFDYYDLAMEEKTECNFKNYILYYKGFNLTKVS